MVTMERSPSPQFSKAQLTSLNLNSFETIEDMALKPIALRSPEWHYLRTKFHEILSSGSKIIRGGQTDTQKSLISLPSFFKSKLKWK
jgi:hypothetical protein